MGAVSMYVQILTSALEAGDLDVSGDELIEHALACRTRMLETGPTQGAYEALAAEVAYDRALIHLCSYMGIASNPAAFADPPGERSRLESLLAREKDIDLVARSRAHLAESGGSREQDARACPNL